MKRICILFLTVVLAVCICIWANAADYTWTPDDGSYQLEFTINADGTLKLSKSTKGKGEEVNVSIPAEVEGKAVTVIGKEAFYNCTYTGTLTIPDSVRIIEAYAFYSSKFTGELLIPEGVTKIDDSAFCLCEGFTGALRLPSTLISIGSNAFYHCKGFTDNLILPEGLSYLGNRSFSSCNFSGDLTIPGSLKDIPEDAFALCYSLDGTVTIGDGVESIGAAAFAYCRNISGTLNLSSSLKTIGNSAFYGCLKLTGTLVLPDGLFEVGEYAFSDCTGLEGLVLPDSLTTIHAYAFESCSGLTGTLDLPDNLTTMGPDAFAYCTGLTGDLIVPGTLKVIPSRAFLGCSGLTSITLSEGVESIGEWAFRACSSAAGKLSLPSTLLSIGPWAFSECTSLTGVTLPSGLLELEEKAFYRCKGLTGDIVIPGSVKAIGKQAFYECKGLTGSITLEEGVESIGDEAFYYCLNAAGELTLPTTLQSIGSNSFYYCYSLTGDLVLSDNLTSIGDYAFYHCENLTGDLILPDNLPSIGNYAFAYCQNLTGELVIPDNLMTIGNYAFSYCQSLTGHLVIPDTITTLGNYAFSYCTGLTGVTFPQGMTSIPVGLFAYCEGLTGELSLPESLTSIGSYAFEWCKGLTGQLRIPDSVSEIGASAFDSCTGFTGTLKLPQDLKILGNSSLRGLTGMSGNVAWPKELTYLGDYALPVCDGITFSTDLPDSITYIGTRVFYQSKTFSGQLHLPSSLKEIGNYAFAYCDGLSGKLTIPDGLTTIGEYAFRSCYGFNGDLILPPGVTSVGRAAFANCEGFSGTLKLPYGISVGSSAFSEVFDVVWLPASLDKSSIGYAKSAGKPSTAVYYYGGTKDYLENTLRYTSFKNYEYIYYESYPALDLAISGGEFIDCSAGKDFTLTAQYYNSKARDGITFAWSSSDAGLFSFSNPVNNAAANGFSAKPSVTVTPLASGTGTITITGPDGLSDSIMVTVSDHKVLSFLPATGQSATEPNVIPVDESISLTFQYETSGSAAEEWQQIQWEVTSDQEGASEAAIGTVRADVIDANTAKLTASVTGVSAGTPVTVTLTGPGYCRASAEIVVVEEKVSFLDENQIKPDEGDKALYDISTGERFTVYLQYNNPAEDADVEELLNSITWIQSKCDFMIHPDDLALGAGDAIKRNSTDAYTLEDVKYDQQEDGSYLIQATFATALEGACGLKVQIGEYASDTCIILSTFDSEAYLAGLLHDTSLPTTSDMYTMLHGDTPATVMLDILKEDGGFQATSVAWQSMKALFDSLEKPSNIYDLAVKEEDLYYGMLLEVLYGSTQENLNAPILNGVKFAGDFVSSISDCFKMVYDVDISQLDPEDVFPDSTRRKLMVQAFEGKYKSVKSASNITEKLDTFVSVAKGVSDLQDRLTASAMLRNISDANIAVLEQMLAECDSYENCDALKKAIERCIDQVDQSSDEAMAEILAGSAAANGVKGIGKLVDMWWGKLVDQVKVSHPVAAMLYASYHSGTTLSNVLGATDATLEEYYKLVALQDIKTIAREAHDTLSANWQDDPAAYLAAVKTLFHIHLLDCDHAIQYVDVADDALLSKAIEVCGGNGFDNATDAFTSFRGNIEAMYYAYQILWVDYVSADYPGVLLGNTYESVFADILSVDREIFFACPVEIYVMDGDEIVAFVSNDALYTTVDDITVTLDGDNKGVIFLNDASYTIRIVGTDEGTMDVTDIRYTNGQPTRTLEYNDLPVTLQGEYLSKRFNTLLDDTGATVQVHCDSNDTPRYTLSVISGQAGATTVRQGENVSVSAVIPEGYSFAGWVCDNEDAVLADPDSPLTTLRMPKGDVVLTALLKVIEVPENRLTLTDNNGLILRDIPQSTFDLQVKSTSSCILATYDANGKLLSVQEPKSIDGLVTVSLDNSNGAIGRIALFRLSSMVNPVPVDDILEIYTD